MYGFIFLIAAAIFLGRRLTAIRPSGSDKKKVSPRLVQAEQFALRLYKEKHYHSAEKAYLNVLKLDHRNASAYSHLGIIYSILHNYAEAVECFELAARFAPSAATFQNLGLGYYENKNYMKSIAAYEKAIMFEASVLRYIGLGKAYDKLGNGAKAIEALEKAVELDNTPKHLELLVNTCKAHGQISRVSEFRARFGASMPTPAAKPAKA
jgi:tetratricopeptide (TPR) repeat protein